MYSLLIRIKIGALKTYSFAFFPFEVVHILDCAKWCVWDRPIDTRRNKLVLKILKQHIEFFHQRTIRSEIIVIIIIMKTQKERESEKNENRVDDGTAQNNELNYYYIKCSRRTVHINGIYPRRRRTPDEMEVKARRGPKECVFVGNICSATLH